MVSLQNFQLVYLLNHIESDVVFNFDSAVFSCSFQIENQHLFPSHIAAV